MPLARFNPMLVPGYTRSRLNLPNAYRREQLDIAGFTSDWCSSMRDSGEFLWVDDEGAT